MLPVAFVDESIRRVGVSSNPVRVAYHRGVALSPLGFSLTLLMGLSIESSLSFLGVGVPTPIPSLGGMMASGSVYIGITPWPTLFPFGIVLVGVVAFWSIAIPVGRGLVPFRQASPAETLLEEAGRPARFWTRLSASLITFIAIFAVLLIAMGLEALLDAIGLPTAFTEVVFVIALVTAFDGTSMASPGKRLLGLQIVRPAGSRAGLARKACRWIVTAATFFVDPFMIAFRFDKRELHDLICDTVVVHRR